MLPSVFDFTGELALADLHIGDATGHATRGQLAARPLPRLPVREHLGRGGRVRARIERARTRISSAHAVRGPGRREELEEAGCAARGVVRARVVAALAPRDAKKLIGIGAPV